jgi:hypothetical protein
MYGIFAAVAILALFTVGYLLFRLPAGDLEFQLADNEGIAPTIERLSGRAVANKFTIRKGHRFPTEIYIIRVPWRNKLRVSSVVLTPDPKDAPTTSVQYLALTKDGAVMTGGVQITYRPDKAARRRQEAASLLL